MRVINLLLVLLLMCGCTNTVIDVSGDVPAVIEPDKESERKEYITEEVVEPEIVIKELFEDYYQDAEEIMQEMTLEEKVSQMFLVIYPGKTNAYNELSKYCPGGYILFANDVKNETKDSLTTFINEFQDKAKEKMFIAVDEEGGSVVRVSAYKQYREKPFESMRKIYARGGMEEVLSDSKEKSELLKSLGINMNLTPVVDLPTNNKSYMYSRTISLDESIVSEFASKIIQRMNEDKMVSSMKHFPGYGDNVDTHTGIAIDNRTLEDFMNKDFKPFIAGIEQGVPTIMVNHNVIKNIDEDYPASLSEKVHDILRNDLGFSGLIVTDSLAMDALKEYVANGEAGAQAVIAGNDMIISHKLEAHVNEILKAINEGRITEEEINTAVRRVLACKLCYGIIEK